MRYHQIFNEKSEITPNGYIVYVNPSKQQVVNLLTKIKTLRGLGNKNGIYLWNAMEEVHFYMQRELGIKSTPDYFLFALTKRKINSDIDWIDDWDKSDDLYWKATPIEIAMDNKYFTRII